MLPLQRHQESLCLKTEHFYTLEEMQIISMSRLPMRCAAVGRMSINIKPFSHQFQKWHLFSHLTVPSPVRGGRASLWLEALGLAGCWWNIKGNLTWTRHATCPQLMATVALECCLHTIQELCRHSSVITAKYCCRPLHNLDMMWCHAFFFLNCAAVLFVCLFYNIFLWLVKSTLRWSNESFLICLANKQY